MGNSTSKTAPRDETRLQLGNVSAGIAGGTGKSGDGHWGSDGKVERVVQTGQLLDLPTEIHLHIFENASPITRRLLGATCLAFYRIYKQDYYETEIVINVLDIFHDPLSQTWAPLIGTLEYRRILSNWAIAPKIGPLMPGCNQLLIETEVDQYAYKVKQLLAKRHHNYRFADERGVTRVVTPTLDFVSLAGGSAIIEMH
ncbi:uncharacterized protein LY89DRAFT_739864 [Mollisia scopiformis]|uniref:F-box domain-containing protein n=1 Tax=Mollisia scopiformis TaxID=149040 RepID=A0A194WTE7_MOLSC|nr:uncharacterized protein LY89DRAFT_739864 [Mollisia scopiformis]KUJ10882.1 hypothetical protein LY89DRAFT_739864 [Mollisia scopiformis]